MANTNRPTTVTAVDADLRARANFHGINEAGQVHYLLGMCEALLAQANARIIQLEAREQREMDERCTHDADCPCDPCRMERAADTAMEASHD